MGKYVERLCSDMASCRQVAAGHQAVLPDVVDSVYLGGGTPSLLPPAELRKLFAAIAQQFRIASGAEITVECAPGTLTQAVVETLISCGVNRVSLGVQSFVDKEAASVARLHTREKVLNDIECLRAAGISNINVDLIAGLPHQTGESWNESLEQAIATGVPHVSVYMLEVDEDSRLGRELIAGGTRYHAHFVPDDNATADFYELACSMLSGNGIGQYEISNFAHAGYESRHNLKYWTRQPYLGFGVDAHSMLPTTENVKRRSRNEKSMWTVAAGAPNVRRVCAQKQNLYGAQPPSAATEESSQVDKSSHNSNLESVRLSTTDSFEEFFTSANLKAVPVSRREALEESFFLGLRLNRGVSLGQLQQQFGKELEEYSSIIAELVGTGLLRQEENVLQLTPKGRLLSNEVFERFIQEPVIPA